MPSSFIRQCGITDTGMPRQLCPFTLPYSSFLVSSTASSFPFIPSLKLRTPLPRPFISSGIFLPPNSNNTTRAMTIIS